MPGVNVISEARFDKSINLSKLISDSIDTYFYSWARKTPCGSYAECFEVHKASDFWVYSLNETSYTNFDVAMLSRPAGYTTVSMRSKMTFDLGYFAARVVLPPTASNGPWILFGFESDDWFVGGVAHWGYYINDGTLRATVGGFNGTVFNNLTGFKPSDATSAYHVYEIMVKPWGIFHAIDGNIRSIVIRGAGDTPSSSSNLLTVPGRFVMAHTQNLPTKNLAVLLDIDGGSTSVKWVWNSIHPWGLRVGEMDKDTPISTPLFNGSNGSWPVGNSVSAGSSWISMPFPALGRSIVAFAASSSGTLTIQLYNPGPNAWYNYQTFSINADTYYVIEIKNALQFARVVYTPSANATIRDAHVIMI